MPESKIEAIIEKMIDDFFTFVLKNPLYFLCSVVYYFIGAMILGGKTWSYIVAFIIYFLSLLIVFSSLGEKILRLLERARPVETRQELDLLVPIFNEVFDEIERQRIYVGNVQICVIDKMTVNACAIGKHTIAISKGAMETFTADELKALVVHEIAHIIYFDTTARLYALVGNGMMTINYIVLKTILYIADTIRDVESESKGLALVFRLIRLFIELEIFITMFLFQAVISINSRKTEFRADRFVYDLGYGEEMIKALYLIEKIQLGDNSSIIQKMTASHPRITSRIKRLENMVRNEPNNSPYQPVPYSPYNQQGPNAPHDGLPF